MLPKINRIRKKRDFEAIFRNSKSLKNNLFILKAAKNNFELNRFGFVVSLKVSKKATVRNKIRRRLSEIAAGEIKNIKTGTDLIFVALPAIANKEFSEIKKSVDAALIKAGLINKNV